MIRLAGVAIAITAAVLFAAGVIAMCASIATGNSGIMGR